jgi:hypothetical protein
MTVPDEVTAERRLIETIQAVGRAVEHQLEPARLPARDVLDDDVLTLSYPPTPTRRLGRQVRWVLVGMAAVLVAALIGIMLLLARVTPAPVRPGGGSPSGHSTVSGVPTATPVPATSAGLSTAPLTP